MGCSHLCILMSGKKARCECAEKSTLSNERTCSGGELAHYRAKYIHICTHAHNTYSTHTTHTHTHTHTHTLTHTYTNAPQYCSLKIHFQGTEDELAIPKTCSCNNGGTCKYDEENNPFCICQPNWSGAHCDKEGPNSRPYKHDGGADCK